MKKFEVAITETLEKVVTVEAKSASEAEKIVEEKYCDGKIELTYSENHLDTEITCVCEVEEANKLHALLIAPESYPHMIEVNDTLESLQGYVEGYIEVLYPFDDPVALIVNEEGKISGKPLNRALRDNGKVYDVIAGNILIVGIKEDRFCSLTPELATKYEKMFHQPEMFFRDVSGRLMVIPMVD